MPYAKPGYISARVDLDTVGTVAGRLRGRKWERTGTVFWAGEPWRGRTTATLLRRSRNISTSTSHVRLSLVQLLNYCALISRELLLIK